MVSRVKTSEPNLLQLRGLVKEIPMTILYLFVVFGCWIVGMWLWLRLNFNTQSGLKFSLDMADNNLTSL
jgi:hypothetical protein